MLSLALESGGQFVQQVLQIFHGQVPNHLPAERKAMTQEDAETVERIVRSGVSP